MHIKYGIIVTERIVQHFFSFFCFLFHTRVFFATYVPLIIYVLSVALLTLRKRKQGRTWHEHRTNPRVCTV